MSLRVWLPLNGTLDNLGTDEVTLTNHGATVNNNGKIGKCYLFDGTNDYITTVDSSYPTIFSGDFSLCFWIYSSADGSRDIYFGNYGISGSGNWFNIERDTSNRLRFWWNGGAIDKHFTTFSIISSDDWTHIAFVRKGNSVRVYKNASFMEEYTATISNSIPSTAKTFNIGGDTRTSGDLVFGGKMNDFRIYDHALSEKEIHDISKALVLHFPLDNNGFGGENLVLNSDFSEDFTSWSKPWGSATGHSIYTDANGKKWCHYLSETTSTTYKYGGIAQTPGLVIKPGTKYTVSADMFASDDTSGIFWFHWMSTEGGGNIGQQNKKFSITTFPQRYYYTFTSTTSETYEINRFRLMIGTGYGTNTTPYDVYLSNIKIEEGSVSTPWSPASEDNAVYDCSGFHNDAILNNITFNTDTPRYDACSEFTSSKYSYVKVTDNKWMAEKAPELTINLWCYVDDWESLPSVRLFSCTERGGFNVEPGNSGYLRFPNSVYTTASGSITYKYSSNELKKADLSPGWHMLTFIKNLEGNKVYVDGEFHSSYNFVNYGEHFNLNARLFLGCEASTANPSSPYYTGKMSDFRLYYTELLPEDIKELYEVGASIDNLQNMHTHWYIEDPTYSNPSITKTGIVKESELEEADKASLFSSGKVAAKEIIEI